MLYVDIESQGNTGYYQGDVHGVHGQPRNREVIYVTQWMIVALATLTHQVSAGSVNCF